MGTHQAIQCFSAKEEEGYGSLDFHDAWLLTNVYISQSTSMRLEDKDEVDMI